MIRVAVERWDGNCSGTSTNSAFFVQLDYFPVSSKLKIFYPPYGKGQTRGSLWVRAADHAAYRGVVPVFERKGGPCPCSEK